MDMTMTMAKTRGQQRGADRRVQFVNDNLELLGFGNARDALIQTVKELFENVVSGLSNEPSTHQREMRTGMVRMKVQLNPHTQVVEVICGDTGVGFETHRIRQLCCGVFETTKADTTSDNDNAVQCGKYGLGLKAAMLYSQQHVPNASLTIVTASKSSEVLYIQLRIDPESEEPAIVQQLVTFPVGDSTNQFSGTEMRIAIPAPEDPTDIEYAIDKLALYFQSLRYTASENIGAEIGLEIGDHSVELAWGVGNSGVDHFISDFGVPSEGIVYATQASIDFGINCMAAVIQADCEEGIQTSVLEITVLRYANHVPLLNADDFYQCSLASSVLKNRVWKKLGYQCARNDTSLVSQITASPTCGVLPKPVSAKMIIALDVNSTGRTSSVKAKYSTLRKSAMDTSYLMVAQTCVREVVEQLHRRGDLPSPRQGRDNELLQEYVPLIANSAASILQRSQSRSVQAGELEIALPPPCMGQLAAALQDLLANQLH